VLHIRGQVGGRWYGWRAKVNNGTSCMPKELSMATKPHKA